MLERASLDSDPERVASCHKQAMRAGRWGGRERGEFPQPFDQASGSPMWLKCRTRSGLAWSQDLRGPRARVGSNAATMGPSWLQCSRAGSIGSTARKEDGVRRTQIISSAPVCHNARAEQLLSHACSCLWQQCDKLPLHWLQHFSCPAFGYHAYFALVYSMTHGEAWGMD